ncbi:MAG: DNA-formamidopyrimidine glycosylase, partial [Bacilli bacterium]|nr:DNA-formamidopyrimidine glycosylase [Bacilli bacterium]
GKTIQSIQVFYPRIIEGEVDAFIKGAEGKKIIAMERKGKWLRFHLDDDSCIYSHLRMEGKYFIGKPGERERKFDHVEMDFTDGTALFYNDQRKFGRMSLMKLSDQGPFDELGDEPWDKDPEKLCAELQKRKDAIKQAIMDQTLIAGIGNIYADETLFACRINPFTPSSSIGLEQCKAILSEASRIMNIAIEEGGSTIKSYHPHDGVDGRMQNELLAYGSENRPCPNCGFPMRKVFLGGRGTTYCPICQKERGRAFVLGITGPIHSGKSTASKYFRGKGYILFDADACVKSLYGRKDVKKAIKKAFGRKAYEGDALNKAYVTEKSKDPKYKKKLEDILHPLVIEEAKKLIHGSNENTKIILDVPLLYQSGMDGLCDAIICIDADESKRRARLIAEGRNAKAIMEINRSFPLTKAKKKATWVIYNDGTEDDYVARLSELPL